MLTAAELRDLKKATLRSLQVFVRAGQKELTDQGHRATGTLIDTMEAVMISEDPSSWRAGIEIEDYGLEVDSGVRPGKVPSPFKDAAEFKRHIDQLREWSRIIKPGLDQLERSEFILAVNRKHRIEGIPTRDSFIYSRNNRRTGWIKHSFEDPEIQEEARQELDKYLFSYYVAFFDRAIAEASKP